MEDACVHVIILSSYLTAQEHVQRSPRVQKFAPRAVARVAIRVVAKSFPPEGGLDLGARRAGLEHDGASGVAVIIELANILYKNPPSFGINLVLFDAEDYGVPGDNWTYCIGSQYFAQNLPIPYPEYSINIDMVADRQPEFFIERISYQQNASLVLELWELSEKLGLKAFKKQARHAVFDDHVPLYEIAGIPAVNIIDFDFPNDRVNYHHTHNDIVQNCSPEGMRQVGTLLVNHIYNYDKK